MRSEAPRPSNQPSAAQMMDALMQGCGSVGGPFTLTDQTGKQRSDIEFRGKLMMVYFGYTFAPVRCGTVCHGSDIAGLVRALNEFCFTAFLRRALDLLTLAPSINQRRFGHLVWINCQSGFCLCVYPAIEMRGMAPSSFRRERPRANAHARSLRPPMGRHSRSVA